MGGRRVMSFAERHLQAATEQLAGLLGYTYCHFRPAIDRSGQWSTPLSGMPGFPDLIMVRGPRIVFAELKAERGTTTPEQEHWLDVLRLAGAETYVWKPADWISGEIEAVLSRKGGEEGRSGERQGLPTGKVDRAATGNVAQTGGIG